MNLTSHSTYKFDSFLPIYNWLYPLNGVLDDKFKGDKALGIFENMELASGRALYFHFPFCETICSFCPFVRANYKNEDLIDIYVSRIIKEIEIKAKWTSVTGVPIRAIFFGGGTPSLLSALQIRRIGATIKRHFNLQYLKEFSFEFEAKSVSIDKIDALKEIGVTHARFGIQTFSLKFRDIFALTATLDQIHYASDILQKNFKYVSCDIIYGINGQNTEDFVSDIQEACKLGIKNLDFYPLNNLVTQQRLHKSFREIGYNPTTGMTKFYMNKLLRRVMYDNGYLPHNGHGFVKAEQDELEKNPPVTDSYSFVYHEHVYGHPKFDLLGFGVNAISSLNGYSINNTESRDKYINELGKGRVLMEVKSHGQEIDACRPLCLALSYHGKVNKAWLNWDDIPKHMYERLSQLINADLVVERPDSYMLTEEGWYWYSNIMYFLLPNNERNIIDRIILNAKQSSKRKIENSGLETFSFS